MQLDNRIELIDLLHENGGFWVERQFAGQSSIRMYRTRGIVYRVTLKSSATFDLLSHALREDMDYA